MISLLVGLAILGFIAWLVITLIPMPAPFPQVIITIACIFALMWVLQAFGLWHGWISRR